MKGLTEIFQSADWKNEKHVPVIEVPEVIKKGENFKVMISVGKKIPHPNTTEHHIAWIDVYFLPDGEKFPINLSKFSISAHGASSQGPNTSTVYTHPEVSLTFKTDKSGELIVFSYCNIHGLWTNSQKISIS
ncbi:hypothetical protein BXT86_06250 [candidate division WOR-3 bacterium 4484_100]|uniref:Desulfoferrodoxin ferrous iron-binding domain-containing protein n=1 Tax=candidate division WOR-3 bacterium 4484_100 TaxID=1936077 RepID=A0A1V4QE32_UNCW3|nr:MAG: hypothetical protein BXT86_06250 [candidate division WOR-3 bacterium 4484_100]